ncbi:MAG: hypothetical protein WAR37_04655 [Candidatus Microsaccharimonas sp.]
MNPEQPYQPQQPQPQYQPAPQPVAQPVPQQPPMYSYGPAPAAPRPHRQSKLWLILTFVFILTTLSSAGFAVYAYLQYKDQKDNVDSKISNAVALAVKEQADKDAADFLEKEKEPNRQFVGPDDYGRVSFDYPKTWSVFEAKDATQGSTYEAYFNPGTVPPISSEQQYALHMTIEDKDYDKVIDSYKALVTKGDLVSSSVKADDQNGTRLDGSFNKNIRGFAVIFKIRDKTVTIRSDAETFKGDFEALIQTITFNK